MPLTPLGVFVPSDLGPRKTVDDDIRPTVTIKIVGVCKETFRIGVVGAKRTFKPEDGLFGAVALCSFEAGAGRPEFVALFEIRTFVPEGSGNHIHLSIVIKIADIGTLGPELVGRLNFFKIVEQFASASAERDQARK